MSDPQAYDVAVVVFVRVPEAADLRDAQHVAEYAVRQAICGPRCGTPAEIAVPRPVLAETVTVADIQDLDTARRYLRTRPTGEPFRRLGEEKT